MKSGVGNLSSRGQSGILYGPSAYFMKHPPKQFTDDQAYKSTEEFITGKNNKIA